jgi:hypothetical protein
VALVFCFDNSTGEPWSSVTISARLTLPVFASVLESRTLTACPSSGWQPTVGSRSNALSQERKGDDFI